MKSTLSESAGDLFSSKDHFPIGASTAPASTLAADQDFGWRGRDSSYHTRISYKAPGRFKSVPYDLNLW